MGYEVVNAVLARSKAKGSDRLVLLVIAAHADEETFECFPGRELLCKEAAMSERNLIYCLKKLEESKELVIIRGTGRGNLTTYRITLEGLKRVQVAAPFIAPERVQDPVEGPQPVAPFIPERVQDIAPFTAEKGCNPAVERVQPTVIKGAKSGNTCKEESSWNQQESSEGEALSPFEIFKRLYPGQASIYNQEVIEAAGIAELGLWEASVEAWKVNQYSARNVAGIIDSYRKRVEKTRQNQRGGTVHEQERERRAKRFLDRKAEFAAKYGNGRA